MNFLEAIEKLSTREYKAITRKEWNKWWYTVEEAMALYTLPHPRVTCLTMDQRMTPGNILADDWEEYKIAHKVCNNRKDDK